MGFKSALTRVINDYGKKAKILKENEEPLSGDDVREGLTAIISVKLEEPQFEGQTKAKLGNSEIRGFVETSTSENLMAFLEENPVPAKIILEKCVRAARAREAARKARDPVSYTHLDVYKRQAICEHYNVKLSDLESNKKNSNIAYPRQVAMYLIREMTDYSLPKIGQMFGGRHYTTVMYALSLIHI